jgi:hypothetical protein
MEQVMATHLSSTRCQHVPACPGANAIDHAAAHVLFDHTDQGWSLLCNGVVLFTDAGELLPDGRTIEPRRLAPVRIPVAA